MGKNMAHRFMVKKSKTQNVGEKVKPQVIITRLFDPQGTGDYELIATEILAAVHHRGPAPDPARVQFLLESTRGGIQQQINRLAALGRSLFRDDALQADTYLSISRQWTTYVGMLVTYQAYVRRAEEEKGRWRSSRLFAKAG